MRYILRLVALMVWTGACVEPVRLPASLNKPVLVVDGLITNEPGVHTVVLSLTGGVGDDLDKLQKLTGAEVKVTDDAGGEYILSEAESGVYCTEEDFAGVLGRTYQLHIETLEGEQYESIPALLREGGTIDSVYQQLRENVINYNDPSLPQDALFFYVDTSPVVNDLRWRWKATYQVHTYPELVTVVEGDTRVPAPLPCSGHIRNGNTILKIDDCECCDCWPEFYNHEALISPAVNSGSDIRHHFIGSVPRDGVYFYDKMIVQIEQLTVSPEVYKFWKHIKIQSEAAGNIFQPGMVKVRGNMINISDRDREVFGVFSVSSIKRKDLIITRTDIPKPFPIQERVKADCRSYYKASNKKPAFW